MSTIEVTREMEEMMEERMIALNEEAGIAECESRCNYFDSLTRKEVLKEIKKDADNISYLSKDEYSNDAEIILTALSGVSHYGRAVFATGEQLRNNKQFLIKAMHINPAIRFVMNPKFKNDADIFLAGIKTLSNWTPRLLLASMLDDMGDELISNQDFMLKLIRIDLCCYHWCTQHLKNDKDFIFRVIEIAPELYAELEKPLQANKDIFTTYYTHKDTIEKSYNDMKDPSYYYCY